MNYFDYLRMTRQEDTKENFIKYLINILDYEKENANNYADFMFKSEGEK